jgi:UDP-3-O-[3-hydroxymyristoyl] glucosamine N-acyltransferase
VSIETLNQAQNSDISFFDNSKYKDDFLTSQAGFCVARPVYVDIAPATMCVIESHDPYRLYAIIATHFYKHHSLNVSLKDSYYEDDYGAKIHKNAILEENVKTAFGVVIEAGCAIGRNTIIQANSFIGLGSHIGRNCVIESNVSVTHSLIGDNVHILAGAKIGQDGFGFAMGKTHQKVPQLGRVIIQDSVSIGANTCIDRGTINDTIIGQGTCIDNMVQVAHNVVIGLNCVIAGNTSIAGSVTFGNYVVCGGHACIAGHIKINDYARISGASAVMRDVDSNQTVAGYPAFESKEFFKSVATLKKLTNKD